MDDPVISDVSVNEDREISSSDKSANDGVGFNLNSKEVKKPFKIVAVTLALLAVIIVLGSFYLIWSDKNSGVRIPGVENIEGLSKLEKFGNDEEFRDYFAKGEGNVGLGFGRSVGDIAIAPEADSFAALEGDLAVTNKQTGATADRYSETNVQVAGIDEPDILKTDGANIYFSDNFYNFFRGMPSIDTPLPSEPIDDTAEPLEEMSVEKNEETVSIMPERAILPAPNRSATKVLAAFPPEDLKELSSISEQGEMLLSGENLVIFSGNKIVGYNISDKTNPSKSWDYELESNNQLITSRLYNGKVYAVTQTYVGSFNPCPMPLIKGRESITIACTDIYRPGVYIPVNSTITVFTLNPDSGNVENKVSFVGSTGTTVVYMSQNNLYVTYTYQTSVIDYFYKFFTEDGKGLVSEELVKRIEEIRSYDLRENTKMTEFYTLLEEYYQSQGSDERLRLENEMENKMKDFAKRNARQLQQTGIAKVALDKFEIDSVGVVPGTPLNQYSLDEYQGNLRIATTTGNMWGFGSSESENDVYVLNNQMRISGSILGLGLGERIYSARFMGDKGYVVTFKQIDPFYVLDLSDPANPSKKGELKIPGYSSYLHPITVDKILGIGMEDGKVKISLFDVSNADNPTEKSKYNLNEYWSEAVNNQRAFLIDEKYSVFFLPAGNSGYVFSYKDDELALVRTVADISAKRALYLNDYLYILGGDKIVVLNEKDWETVKTFSF